ncbi:acyl-CoA dehydrogenase [Rhodococcus sp. 14C212]|uniref:acyl-CoA dehydrogenase family protein n=1 Tax=Rhodococcus sp. 14C212 TaxID=2711209 RepID=UPI0013EBC6E1|nr:acyl-CoA dehydrogenase [Rhodococcus sp. 14C212]
MEFTWTTEDEAFRKALAEFLDEEMAGLDLRPGGGPGADDHVELSKRFTRVMAERRWLTPNWPSEYGGGDATAWQHIIMSEELWKRGEPRGPQYMNVNWIGPAIMAFGTEEQKAYHLSRISAGDVIWCQGFSEPEAGTDLAGLKTTAVRDGDHFVINGQKIWTSYANNAEFSFFLARTDPTAERHDGISIFLMPMDLPGIEVRDIPAFVGQHIFHEVFLSDVRIPASALLGEENRGWPIIRDVLAHERVGAPKYARATYVLDRVAETAEAQGRLDDPQVLQALGTGLAACEAARLLAYTSIDERAKGMRPSGIAYAARAAMVQADRAVATAAQVVLGADVLAHDALATDQMFTAFTAGVATGTYEVQLELISRLILKLPRTK